MNSSVEIVEYKGKKILFSDYSGLGGAEFTQVVQRHYEQHRAMFDNAGETFLFLTDVTNTFADRETMKLFKKSITQNRPFIRKSAVVGVTGIQQVLLKSINVFSSVDTRLFKTKEEALDWLAE
ncbi:MAG: STAS/SEC14 domain-containing protein [Deltaproteobacteria bacterium]|nr:STAS/SEC14 domain-containing protein [Deltaproteobacteria bacterium]MBN2673046.1 STAS/SEC14 domain-containing protein [Deltaproteobacteria bacterium]